uniref:Armadillo repeatcontaining protein putative n=1 Tax=Albugo laibachii Nc14 TaxID=890382 RepID=F0VZ93_9STRA|nr:armadillo repeatcontaining protein putative [Albugo laibachii Nc14]|eukprot:CCA14123.1 armadillo repeatcontaining protein putative [Albugo laibachii Nc14]
MGKARKQTGRKKKALCERPPSRDTATPEDDPLLQGLVDLHGSVRETTCVVIANMFGDALDPGDMNIHKQLDRMVRGGLCEKLIPRIVDPLKMVRLHALGALRNLSIAGGVSFCETLITSNVITPLIKVLSSNGVAETFQSTKTHAESLRMLEQAIALLTNLCENSPNAIRETLQGNLIDPIMQIIRVGAQEPRIHTETLRCMMLLTDHNPTLNALFASDAMYPRTFNDLLDMDVSLYRKLLVAAIIINIPAMKKGDGQIVKCIPYLEVALEFDASNVVQQARHACEVWHVAQKTLLEEECLIENGELSSDESEAIKSAQGICRSWRENVQTLVLAMELVAEIASIDEDAMDEQDWGSDDEEIMEEFASSHMNIDSDEPKLTAALLAIGQSRILHLCRLILRGLVAVPDFNSAIASDFETMRIRVCNALNNLLQVPRCEVLATEASAILHNLCTIYEHSPTHLAKADTVELETAITSAMQSVLRQYSSIDLERRHFQLLLQRLDSTNDAEAKMNLVGVLSCVGTRQRDMNENALIGQSLLSRLNDPDLEVVVASLNAIFDIYADEVFDTVFKSMNALSALETTLAMCRTKLRAEQSMMDRDVISHVKESLLNLKRFLKYKKQYLAV